MARTTKPTNSQNRRNKKAAVVENSEPDVEVDVEVEEDQDQDQVESVEEVEVEVEVQNPKKSRGKTTTSKSTSTRGKTRVIAAESSKDAIDDDIEVSDIEDCALDTVDDIPEPQVVYSAQKNNFNRNKKRSNTGYELDFDPTALTAFSIEQILRYLIKLAKDNLNPTLHARMSDDLRILSGQQPLYQNPEAPVFGVQRLNNGGGGSKSNRNNGGGSKSGFRNGGSKSNRNNNRANRHNNFEPYRQMAKPENKFGLNGPTDGSNLATRRPPNKSTNITSTDLYDEHHY